MSTAIKPKKLNNKNTKKKSERFTWVDGIILVLLLLACLLIIYPFYNAFLVSISSERSYLSTPFMLLPKEITLDSYIEVINNKSLLSGYAVTIFLTTVGTAIQLFFTVLLGYAMSRNGWIGKNIIMNLIIFTMFFGGGLIPYYYLIKSIGLYDNLMVMIIPGAISTYNMLLIRNYFQRLPAEMEESAKIDGANDIIIMVRIFIPLALPMIATIALFFAVGNWNQWYNGMLFIENPKYKPLQLVLRELIVTNTMNFTPDPMGRPQFSDGLKMASVFFTIIPIMLVYPFLQRYFVSGLVVGAIKG